MRKLNAILHTAGDGLWSDHVAAVRVTGMELGYVDPAGDFAELRVYFDEDTWSVDQHGLIYTDSQFVAELSAMLDTDDISYSEQGMQGEDYVSFDVSSQTIDLFREPV